MNRPGPGLSLEVLPQRLLCTAVNTVPGRKDRWEQQECNADAEHECINCGGGVCIRCTLPCYQCGEHLHEECREAHAEETGHQIDLVKPGEPQPIVMTMDQFVEELIDVFIDRVDAVIEEHQ